MKPLLALALLAACATARPMPAPEPDAGSAWSVGRWHGSGCVELGADAGLILVPCQVER